MPYQLWVCLSGIGITLTSIASPMPADSAVDRETRPCVECHEAISRSFAETRMARAATGERFRVESSRKGFPNHCLNCHAPNGGAGVVCGDCHGTGGHPYPEARVPEICARCHDAPGENTLRGYRQSTAARRGEDCLDCHLSDAGPNNDHHFKGPSSSGFLEGIARLRLFIREDQAGRHMAVVRITHSAGHALPGGTTGRSVWLVVTGLRADETIAWRDEVRFGWEHHGDQAWRDQTLPPGRPAVLELPDISRNGSTRLHVGLYYRFAPGPLSEPDAEMVTLDVVELTIPANENTNE